MECLQIQNGIDELYLYFENKLDKEKLEALDKVLTEYEETLKKLDENVKRAKSKLREAVFKNDFNTIIEVFKNELDDIWGDLYEIPGETLGDLHMRGLIDNFTDRIMRIVREGNEREGEKVHA